MTRSVQVTLEAGKSTPAALTRKPVSACSDVLVGASAGGYRGEEDPVRLVLDGEMNLPDRGIGVGFRIVGPVIP